MTTNYDALCMDYNFHTTNGDVWMHPCHDGGNQKWYFDGASIKTKHDDRCLDYNVHNNNIVMYPCHGDRNQQWYFDDKSRLRTRYDDKCLDYNYGNRNAFMHPCHDGKNQQWVFETFIQLSKTIQDLATLKNISCWHFCDFLINYLHFRFN